ncbi:hypothetical protein HPP92_018973 [Vanilla planifolia]|uniref:LOB domain-containing protein n=1 Tax=Vanilla planifolia TaxID=51239 RepID=A0A835UJ04_VANPL|nr:hypothetical protein HPP92_019531 [Vanilla planifolia]KAG0464809.1 hypothetical protein HPP92_018973 [Vanilla planifolia]
MVTEAAAKGRKAPSASVKKTAANAHGGVRGPSYSFGLGGGRAPCGACKFLRRRCGSDCVFAPHFASEQGAARFAAVHKVFGASNVSKLLQLVPPPRRHDAVVTIYYEAQARLSDPVLGCVSTVLSLRHQVVQLQAELSVLQSQLINSRLAAAGALQYPGMPQQLMAMQPADYSASSSVSNNMNFNGYASFGLDFCDARILDLLQLLRPSQDAVEEVEESQNLAAFSNEVYNPK